MIRHSRRCSRGSLFASAVLVIASSALAAETRVPKWDARGLGLPPAQGISCLQVSDDGSRIVVGTIALPGDPNVHVLDGQGKVLASYKVGQRWIEQVAVAAGDQCFALCTMTTGASGDEPQAYHCGPNVAVVNGSFGGTSLFHYGDHSNHIGKRMAAWAGGAVTVNQEQVLWLDGKSAGDAAANPTAKTYFRNLKATALAVHPSGVAILGGYVDSELPQKPRDNLFVYRPGEAKPVWSRPVVSEVGASNPPEPGEYGRPIHPNGRRDPLAQHDDPMFAPLSIAISREAQFDKASRIATADYRGWQRWIRSSGSGKEESYGARFMPAKPAITVYDGEGNALQKFNPEKFSHPGWVDLVFLPGNQKLLAYPHRWTSRGLAGQPSLPVDEQASTLWLLDVASGSVQPREFPDAISSVAVSDTGRIAVACWNGEVYTSDAGNPASDSIIKQPLQPRLSVGGPALVEFTRDGKRLVAATNAGTLTVADLSASPVTQALTDLNQVIPRAEKPWVKNAKAEPLAKGLWKLPGGRVESDLGGQCVIEGPDGLILIEGHSGLSFESEWAALEAAGLDPRRVKYVVATHEHGDHAPGSYLWRVATGAQFICSREMAYVLQHHLPVGTGYGFHPPVPTDIRIEDDTQLDLAGVKIGAIRLSGHTFGSMGWLFERDGKRYVAIGDLIMPDGVLGYAGSINFSPYQVLESLRKLDDLKVDLILPGHGPIVGPDKYVGAGISVGRNVGWGKMKPEAPNPRFRLTQPNVVVAGFLSEATSADFGDINGDGAPDVALVAPHETGSVIKVFLNHRDRKELFDPMKPDFEVAVPEVSSPGKLRLRDLNDDRRLDIFISGQSTVALMLAREKAGEYDTRLVSGQEVHQIRMLDTGEAHREPVILGRFSGSQVVKPEQQGKQARTDSLKPQIQAPYVDVRELDINGDGRSDWIVNDGRIWLRGENGKIADAPSLTLPKPVADAWCYLGIGDFNGDRQPDVALVSYGANQKQITHLYRNTGDRQKPFADTPSAVLEVKSQFSHVRDAPPVADWNGDGLDDLFVGLGQDNQVRIYLGGSDGLNADRVELLPLEYRLHYEHGLSVADFNGDGRLDLACFGYTQTGVGAGGPPAGYIWLQPAK